MDKVLAQAKDTLASVWKWDNGKWAVYLPSEEGSSPGAYANSKGFSLLTTLNPGEGFWVNSKALSQITIPGTPEDSALVFANGWNLLGPKSLQPLNVSALTGANSSIISMWKWDNGKWAVYLPSEGSPGTYANSKGFSVLATINPGEGFWANVTVSSGTTTTAPSSSTTTTSTTTSTSTSSIPTTTTTTTTLPAALPATSLTVPGNDADGAYPVSWTASATSGVTYVLEEATDSTFSTGLSMIYSGLETSANISERVLGTTYYYRVKATKTDFTESAWHSGDNGCKVTGETSAVILTDPESDIAYMFTNGVGDGIAIAQKLDSNGQKVLDKVVLKDGATGAPTLVQFNDDGLPASMISGDFKATYANYTASTVDVLIYNPDGSTTLHAAVALGDSGLFAKAAQASSGGLMKQSKVALPGQSLPSATKTGNTCIDKDCSVYNSDYRP